MSCLYGGILFPAGSPCWGPSDSFVSEGSEAANMLVPDGGQEIDRCWERSVNS